MGTEIEGTETPRWDAGVLFFLLGLILIGSTTAFAAKMAVKSVPLGLLPLARFGTAGLCLLPVIWRSKPLGAMIRRDWPRLLATASLCIPINQAFFLGGTKLAPTSHVGVIYATCPLFVLILACTLGQEKLAMRRLIGVAASVTGVVVIGLGNVLKQGAVDLETLRGDWLLVGAVISWGAYLTVNKPLVSRYGSIPTLAGTFLLGSLLQFPITMATSSGWESIRAVPLGAWWSVLYLGVIVSVTGLFCQNQAMLRLEASQVATASNAGPLLTIVWGVSLLGEPLTAFLVLGACLTLGGILWASRREPSPTAASETEGLSSPYSEALVTTVDRVSIEAV